MVRSLVLDDFYALGRFLHGYCGWPLASEEQAVMWDRALKTQCGLCPTTILVYILATMAGCCYRLASLHLECQGTKLAEWVAA